MAMRSDYDNTPVMTVMTIPLQSQQDCETGFALNEAGCNMTQVFS